MCAIIMALRLKTDLQIQNVKMFFCLVFLQHAVLKNICEQFSDTF